MQLGSVWRSFRGVWKLGTHGHPKIHCFIMSSFLPSMPWGKLFTPNWSNFSWSHGSFKPGTCPRAYHTGNWRSGVNELIRWFYARAKICAELLKLQQMYHLPGARITSSRCCALLKSLVITCASDLFLFASNAGMIYDRTKVINITKITHFRHKHCLVVHERSLGSSMIVNL